MSYYRYITSVYKSYLPELNRTLRSSSVPRTVTSMDYCEFSPGAESLAINFKCSKFPNMEMTFFSFQKWRYLPLAVGYCCSSVRYIPSSARYVRSTSVPPPSRGRYAASPFRDRASSQPPPPPVSTILQLWLQGDQLHGPAELSGRYQAVCQQFIIHQVTNHHQHRPGTNWKKAP